MSMLEVSAPDISCDHCKRSIEHDLGEMPGVREVAVDVASRAVRVDYDSSEVSEDAIVSKLDEIGYPPARGA